ncbi:MAG: outer membrane lipoprotein-sorting protein [Kangiellaceae bacterium]|nr:outer membrane lipoprotein-sorting protein [Kangiellaceae bacterium]
MKQIDKAINIREESPSCRRLFSHKSYLFVLFLCSISNVISAEHIEKQNKFPIKTSIESWQLFVQHSGKAEHKEWLKAIQDPRAISLAKKWKELLGYDATELINKYKLPPGLKPGLTINKKNIKNFSWIKDYLPLEMYQALNSSKGYLKQFTIVPTNTYYQNLSVLESTKKNQTLNTPPITDSNSSLINQDGSFTLTNANTAAAIPYLHPKNGLELTWSFVAHGVGTETLALDPVTTLSCSQDGNTDYIYQAAIWWQKFHGRSQIGDKSDIPGKEGIIEAGAIFAYKPFDVNGFAGVRQRYADGRRVDDFKVFLPAMKRTRVLSGADAQDPMWAGLEVTWDDWRSYWVKTNTQKFAYRLLGERLILASPEVGYIYNSGKFNKETCKWDSLELELRPVWVLEITDKSGSYQYKKRTIYIDMETFYSQYQITTDQRDNPYRTWEDSRAWRPYDGDAQWRHVTIFNAINKRVNYFFMTSQWEERWENVTDEQFDIDQLRDYQ